MTEALARAIEKAHGPEATPEERELCAAFEDLLACLVELEGKAASLPLIHHESRNDSH